MQVQRIQNNSSNPYFTGKRINIDVKLKMTDLSDHLQKKIPSKDLKSFDLKSLFEKANTNKKNKNEAAILSGDEIYDFFTYAWQKLNEKYSEIYFAMQDVVGKMRNEMWRSIERDLTPKQKEEMKNLISLQKKYSNEKAKCIGKLNNLKQSDKSTPEQIRKAEEEFDAAVKRYQDVGDKIYDLKYDKSKLDKTKYVDLGDK